jgi:gluconokinase
MLAISRFPRGGHCAYLLGSSDPSTFRVVTTIHERKMIIILMGVSASGKSTVGRLLARRLGWEFHDGDDLHPDANVRKMASGTPLTDDDRWPWLARIVRVMKECDAAGRNAVIACSALRKTYRDYLRRHGTAVEFVFLRGERQVLRERIRERSDHFMPAALLDSQFDALEEPQQAVVVDVDKPPAEIVEDIVHRLSLPS